MTEPNPTGAVRIRDMAWNEFMQLLRTLGPEIGKLMKNGDQLATTVMAYYRYAHDHPRDQKANLNLRTAVEDYINRDLRDAERLELGGKFGHRLPEPEKESGPRIFVPNTEGVNRA
ncbi:MAG TPA: hypothetical protein VLH80_07240 [Nitrospiraceae bacterium]|nr:hypothetical protein [Nitrospiraceae bacterium]